MLDLFTGSYITSLLGAVLCYAICQYLINRNRIWRKLGINYAKTTVPVFEDIYTFLTTPQDQLVREKRRKYGKIYGDSTLGRSRLVIADPEVVRQICIKDFDYFPDHEVSRSINEYHKNSLVWIEGDHWKRVRALMSPTFTSGKMKRMFKLMDGCADDLVENFREQYETQVSGDASVKPQVDLVKTFGLYTIDGIATCCYGIKLKRDREVQSNDLSTASRGAFAEMAGKMLEFSRWRMILLGLLPRFLLDILGVKLMSDSSLKPLANRVQKMIDIRLANKDKRTRYDDLLQLLIDAKLDDELDLGELDQNENHHAGLTTESLVEDQAKLKASLANEDQKKSLGNFEILCEAMFMLAAGLDTTRASLSTITYFLAHNPDVQEKLYQDVKLIANEATTSAGTKRISFDYDALASCNYLDAVISEGLRRFTPAVMATRITKKDYYIEKYGVKVPKGLAVNLALYAMHMDPEYWNEPEKFDPERFMPGRREKIVPGSYAPFSMGPRHCIGMRFSLMETKLGLAKAIMNFKFEPAPSTEYPPNSGRKIGIMTVNDCRVTLSPRQSKV